jgi:hypothetical protein
MVEEKLKKTKIDGEAAKRQQTTQTTNNKTTSFILYYYRSLHISCPATFSFKYKLEITGRNHICDRSTDIFIFIYTTRQR